MSETCSLAHLFTVCVFLHVLNMNVSETCLLRVSVTCMCTCTISEASHVLAAVHSVHA